MKYRIYEIQLLKILVHNISMLAIWSMMGIDAFAAQNSLPTQSNIKTVVPFSPSTDLSLPHPSFTPILIGGPDNFKPKFKSPSLTAPDSRPETIFEPTETLGWPQLSDSEKRRKVEQDQQDKAKEDERQRKIAEIEQKIKRKLEDEQKRALEQEANLKRKQEQKIKEALFQTQEREERREQKRLKALEIEQKRQAKLNEEEKKRQALEAKRKEREESKNQRKLAKSKKEKSKTPLITLKSLSNDSSSSVSSLGQGSQASNGTAVFELFNKDLLSVSSGFNTYSQSTVKSVQNIPLKIGWEREMGKYTVSVTTGIDWFSRAPIGYSFKANAKADVTIPSKLGKALLVSAEVDYGPYKFNAETIQNRIQYLRARGSLFWQIDSKTTFSSINYVGILNDKNLEFQSFNRVERKIGKFTVAGNLFSWNFKQDLSKQSGYFSPPDFLVYNVELAWEDKITKFLSCRLSATLGQQRANRKFSNANTLQALCSAKLTKNIDLDFGYAFSNIFTGGNIGNGSANTNTILGGLNVRF